METARTVAIDLVARGYHPVPLLYKTKIPEHKSWQRNLYGLDDIDTQFPEGEKCNIGVLLGTEVQPSHYLMAVDIDFTNSELEVARVHRALGGGPVPMKVGQKGGTFFAWINIQQRKILNIRRDAQKKILGQIEILGFGQQTVLPPSVHPDTGREYEWDSAYGPPLHKTKISDLPFLTASMLDEIKMVATTPDAPFFQLDEMEWNGPGGGGNVHDTILAVTGLLVERKWAKQDIVDRISRAARNMLDGNPKARDWNWDIFTEMVMKQIDGALAKGFGENSKRGRKGHSRIDMQNMATDALIADFGGMDNVGVIDGVFRVYSDGWWKEWNEDSLLRRVIQSPDNWSWMTRGDAIGVVGKTLLAASYRHRKPHDIVMTPKGPIDMKTGEIVASDKESLLTFVLPVDYNPDAKCPLYEKFITELFTVEDTSDEDRDAAIRCFEEYCGLTFVQDTSFQKALIIEGPTGTGKSTILRVVEAMHEPSARSTLDLYDLRSERTTSALVGKTVSFTFEVGQEEYVPADIFKQIADGSTIPVRRLYAEKFDAAMTARMIIACNTMFKFRDSSGAVERRMILLKSRQTIPEDRRDRDLENKLKEEIPGIFNRFMKALRNLRERGRFDPPRYMSNALESLAESSDPVLRWIRDRTYQGMAQVDPSFKVPPNMEGEMSSMLYADFKDWAQMHGHKVLNDVNWGERCTKRGFPSRTKRTPATVLRIRNLNLINKGKI